MENPLRILGIDPGSRQAGFALIEESCREHGTAHAPRWNYLSAQSIRYRQKNFLARMREIYLSTEALIERYRPHHVALETLIFTVNVSSLAKLSQARGAILATFPPGQQEFFEYSPTAIKSIVSGYGHADKMALQKMLFLILGVKAQEFDSHDASDALAIALCHAWQLKRTAIPSKKGFSKRSFKSAKSAKL